ncbi:hypothetical protein BOX15_Mlig032537g1 [Macrostomum lignano]|uniref:Cytochrome P450 n=2 Tax=Macrostomum lignano TaxID=282301 RepID=A0A1I8HQC0_9PLAT|nr:hypothetical protein BOX15_Mlig032537g1 [Macrostomum lignano]
MFIAVLLIGVIICLYHLHVYQVRSRVAHIPGPPCHWFYLFGNAGELIKSKKINQRRLMLKYFKLYGPVFRLVIFHKVLIFSYGPAANRTLLSRRLPKPAAVFSMLHSMFGVRFMGRSLVAETDHGRWLQRRRQVRGIFSAEFANGSVGTINEACTALVRLLNREATGEQRLLQIESYFGKVTLEVTCRVGFGFTSGALDTAEASEMQSYVQGAMEGIAIKTESPFAWLGRPAKVAKVRRCLISLRSLLSKRVVSTVDVGVSMIDEMVNKLSGMLSEEELVDEAVTLFSAGQETTASLLSSLLMELGRQPEAMEKIVNEIDSVCSPDISSHITLEQLNQMPYLEAAVKEALRLYPPAPIVARVATEATGPVEIGGHLVPPGYPIYLSLQATHLLCFKDGAEFQPDRFLAAQGPPPSALVYGPFGFGERACAGHRLAMLMARLTVAHLLRAFQLTYPADQCFHTVQVGSLKPLRGVPVMLEMRHRV